MLPGQLRPALCPALLEEARAVSPHRKAVHREEGGQSRLQRREHLGVGVVGYPKSYKTTSDAIKISVKQPCTVLNPADAAKSTTNGTTATAIECEGTLLERSDTGIRSADTSIRSADTGIRSADTGVRTLNDLRILVSDYLSCCYKAC